jgi:ribosomal protein L29
MKSNELKELKQKEDLELTRLLKANREKARELRFSINANQLKDIKSLNKVKKLIARIMTIQKAKKK